MGLWVIIILERERERERERESDFGLMKECPWLFSDLLYPLCTTTAPTTTTATTTTTTPAKIIINKGFPRILRRF